MAASQDSAAWASATINLSYLVASVLFLMGIKGLTHPRTAVKGNILSAIGMAIAMAATFGLEDVNWAVVIGGLVVGAVIGTVAAVRVKMTGMPEMVGLFNGFGGAASVFVAWVELLKINPHAGDFLQSSIASGAAGLIGGVTLMGSLMACGKLMELKIFWSPWRVPGQNGVMVTAILVSLGICGWIVAAPEQAALSYTLLVVLSLVLGILVVGPIGGADMPVVIAFLNSLSGLAAAATGFVISNTVLIIAGSLVGASGLILTHIMCVAMNRTWGNVFFSGIDASKATSSDDIYTGKVKSTTADEIAMMLDTASRVVIVPGYGMAVAQAQHAVRDLYLLLEEHGVNVEFAIHPVAGRMPGHMNVLLAEVDIPYDKLLEPDQINPQFEQIDVAIVLGANDVVNPDARRADSPIAGMPIIDVDKARVVIVVKRSLSPGYAKIPNPLFAADNTMMFFADGKKAVMDIVAAIKEQ
ncbi:MAG: NAD synthetase [Phycisphaera sp.]|nr:NAD synthetase [Phycisphaera sp.]